MEVEFTGGEPFVDQEYAEGDSVWFDVVISAEGDEVNDAAVLGFGDGAVAALADLAPLSGPVGDVGVPRVGVASFANVGFAGLVVVRHGLLRG